MSVYFITSLPKLYINIKPRISKKEFINQARNNLPLPMLKNLNFLINLDAEQIKLGEIIEEISAANKLKDYLTKKKTKYSERKRLSIEITKKKLEEKNNLHHWLPHFIDHKKKDDLADSYLQGLWYIKYKL